MFFFVSRNRTERQRLKGSWMLKNRYLVTSKTNYAELEDFFQKLFMWPCSNVVQIDRTLVYSILRATAWASWHRKFYSSSQLLSSTVYCSKFTVIYGNQMPSVETGCRKTLVAFCRKVTQESLWHTNFIHEHVPVTLRCVTQADMPCSIWTSSLAVSQRRLDIACSHT